MCECVYIGATVFHYVSNHNQHTITYTVCVTSSADEHRYSVLSTNKTTIAIAAVRPLNYLAAIAPILPQHHQPLSHCPLPATATTTYYPTCHAPTPHLLTSLKFNISTFVMLLYFCYLWGWLRG